MKTSFWIAGLIGFASIGSLAGAAFFQTSDLDRIHDGIEAAHEGVEHISGDHLASLPADEIVLFDVREAGEFAVSHLPGAILVNPQMGKAEFEDRFGESLKGKRAVFYCSVGVRSSMLAERVADLIEDRTGKAPSNLIGGLFQWSNENRAMILPNGVTTSAIHPYDAYWGRLIENRQAISYSSLQ